MSTGAAASPPPPSARGRRLTDPGPGPAPGPGARRPGWMWCRSPRILLDRKLEIPDSRTWWRSVWIWSPSFLRKQGGFLLYLQVYTWRERSFFLRVKHVCGQRHRVRSGTRTRFPIDAQKLHVSGGLWSSSGEEAAGKHIQIQRQFKHNKVCPGTSSFSFFFFFLLLILSLLTNVSTQPASY